MSTRPVSGWQIPFTFFRIRLRSSIARRMMCFLSVTQVGLGPLMSRMPLRRLTKSGPLMAWKRCTSSGAWGRNSEKEEAVAPAKTKTAPGMGRGLPSRVYSPSCMGARKYFQPAPGDPAQLGVKLVEEDQGDQPVFIAQSLMEGVEELGDRAYWTGSGR